jgi:hypothetical protein
MRGDPTSEIRSLVRRRVGNFKPDYVAYRLEIPQRVIREWRERYGEVPKFVRVYEEGGKIIVEPYFPERGVGSGG